MTRGGNLDLAAKSNDSVALNLEDQTGHGSIIA
jgi:hypothetical protein